MIRYNRISNIHWRLKGTKGVIDFEYSGTPITIAEPSDVILGDNEASKQWIAKNYGFLLAVLD